MTTDRYQPSTVEHLQASGATVESSEPMTLEEIFVVAVMRGREEISR
jgi:hypothetical protein